MKDFKTLIEDVIEKNLAEYPYSLTDSNHLPYKDIIFNYHTSKGIKSGAKLPTELLLESLDALEWINKSNEVLYKNENQHEAYFTLFRQSQEHGVVAKNALDKIRKTLEELAK